MAKLPHLNRKLRLRGSVKNKNLMVIGVPSNDFGGQELETNEEIVVARETVKVISTSK